jgi:hypothetical protein
VKIHEGPAALDRRVVELLSRPLARAPGEAFEYSNAGFMLLAAVVEHSYEEWYATQPAWDLPEPGTPWTDDLRSHLAQSLGSLAERPIFMRLGYLLLLLRREDPPPGRARFLEVRTHARAAMSGWFTDAAPELAEDAPALAMVMMALSDGLFFSNTLDDPGWHPAHFADLVALGFTSVTR